MALEHRRPREYDDDADLDIRKPNAGSGRWLKWLALAVIAIGLTVCLTGTVILLVRSASGDATAAKLPGAWQGRFVVAGRAIDAVYVFERGGEFRQETLNPRGNIEVSKGRWRVFLDKIEIAWDNGGFEHATVTWTNDQTMQWKIVDHNDEIQIGSVTTMRRRQPLPRRHPN